MRDPGCKYHFITVFIIIVVYVYYMCAGVHVEGKGQLLGVGCRDRTWVVRFVQQALYLLYLFVFIFQK